MNFFMEMVPPTSTAQMKKVSVIHNRPVFYEPAKVKAAKKQLTDALMKYRPADPFEGPLELTAVWMYPKGKSHKDHEWRSTKPDTDNIQKLLKDCMTKTGFWIDDAQVAREIVEKKWSDEPTGIMITIKKLGNGL